MKGKSKKYTIPNSNINEYVLQNTRIPTGQNLILETQGVLHQYHHDHEVFLGERHSKRLKAELGWFEKLTQHAPSVGTFYEDTLRALIKELLSSNETAATGFVFDPLTRKNSKQIDILVYGTEREAPFFKRDNFVVVPPQITLAQSEVKKSLTLKDIRDIIKKTFCNYVGEHSNLHTGCSELAVFAYRSKTKSEKILETISEEINRIVSYFTQTTPTGKQITFPSYGFVLPAFYFLDRAEYIKTSIEPTSDKEFKLVVTRYHSVGECSLNEYLHQMTKSFKPTNQWDRDFITNTLLRSINEREIINGIWLIQKIAVLELLNTFPHDHEAIKAYRVQGRRPYNAVIKAGIKVSTFRNFKEFLKIVQMWETHH